MSTQKRSAAKTVCNSLSRQQRLRTPVEFKQVYQSKQWGSSEHFTFNILAHVSEHKRVPRLGVTVSKKVAKQAVIRNRIKRQIKEFYRLHSQSLGAADLVITAKPSCAKANDQDRLKSLDQLWQKIRKWQRWYSANHSYTEQ